MFNRNKMKKNNVKKYFENSKDYINRWVVSYADFTTVLLALFVFLFALSNNDNIKIKDFKDSIKKEFKQEKTINKTAINENENKDNVINETSKNDSLFELVKNNLGNDNKIEIIQSGKGITLRLKDTLLFDSASAEIKPNSLDTISDIANFLTTVDNPVIIEGHTDSIPIKNSIYATNWELSSARAINLIKYLTENYKLSPKRLSAVGYGEYAPIYDNTTNKGREKNRRVDIIILDNKIKKEVKE